MLSHANALAPAPAAREGTAPLRGVPPGAPACAPGELWAAAHLSGCDGLSCLERLASHALRFTPRVGLVPPDGLLLEVQGSLHLFGGAARLREQLRGECQRLGLQPLIAFAPTPLAALAAARAGHELLVSDAAQLTGQLAGLPLAVLRWPEDSVARLARMGVRTVGALLRLPRAGFARRFGAVQLAVLDQLTGRTRQVVTAFRARERFRRRRDLGCELSHHAALLHALAPLFEALGTFLTTRQCAVLELECRLLHRQAAPTRCRMPLALPCADGARLQGLFAEYLSRLQLPEAVRACELRAAALVAQRPDTRSLWQPGEHGGDEQLAGVDLIERLRARLGTQAVHGLALREGHRPEHCWALSAPPPATLGRQRATDYPPRAAGRRPLWLLPAPQPLRVRDGLPCRRGPLRLVSELERIESGWWDDADVSRDYYTAIDPYGVRLWVFRERAAPHGWFVHGVFG